MANYTKRDARNAETVRKFEEAKAKGEEERNRLLAVRCASCKRNRRKFLVDLGGFCYCDECVELAAKMIAEQKAGK